MGELNYRISTPADINHVKELLAGNSLPVDDISTSEIKFLIACDDQKSVGCIGVEIYNTDALLRSFAVDKNYRNRKIGDSLFNQLIDFCKKNKIHSVHLLTTTAEQYFAKRGFIKSERNLAPESIRSTAEFTSLCPSSSTYMAMQIQGNMI